MRFPLDESLGFIINRTNTRLKNEFHKNLRHYGITPEQWGLLGRLWETKGITQKELARLSSKDQPTTARILDKLERKGLVRREANPDDRRTFLIYLTEQGRGLQDKLVPIAVHTLQKAFYGFNDKEIKQLKVWLNRVYENLESD